MYLGAEWFIVFYYLFAMCMVQLWHLANHILACSILCLVPRSESEVKFWLIG